MRCPVLERMPVDTQPDMLGPYILGPNDTPENGIYTGDARELAKAIPDESVDLIFTDPPYAREFLWAWEWLGQEASRILKEGSLLVAMSGQLFLPKVYAALELYLNYHWTYILETSSPSCVIWPRRLATAWKPVIAYSKGVYRGPFLGSDVFHSMMSDKRFHVWGQSISSNMAFLSRLNGIICLDPLCGGGTVPAVCKMLGRKYLAFEIDPDVAETARERVRNTQMPLFVLEPEQIEMGL